MKKKALLISSPGKEGADSYLKGTKIDIQNFKRHLASPVGGGWLPGEIEHLTDPSVSSLRIHLATLRICDYAVVYFTGHGSYSESKRERILDVNPREQLSADEFRSVNTRTLVILDCCQVVTSDIVANRYAEGITKMSAGRIPNMAACRIAFENAIRNSTAGVVECVSCSVGEFSTDSSDRGGYYTSSLFDAIDDWAQKQQHVYSQSETGILSIVEAQSEAEKRTSKKSGGRQNPSISKTKTGPYFPIAVFK